jgi:PAS domain S-box-containing protein
MTDAFSAWDQNFRYTYVNARAAQLLGMPKDQLIGRSVWDLFPESVGTEVYRKCQQAMVERVSLYFDAFFPVSNAWYENYVYPTKDGLSIYWRDITERKRAEQKLAHQAHLLENVHDAVIAMDERLAVTAWNKGAEQMYGWRADEVLGRNVREVVRSDLTDDQCAEALSEPKRLGRFRIETITYRKDGGPVYVEGLTIALREEQEQGPITGYVNITRDVTERKRAEEAVSASSRRIENILESMSDTFSAVDREWRYTYLNERAMRRIRRRRGEELRREDFLGKSCWEVFPELVGSAIYQKYYEAMREQRTVHFEAYSTASESWIEVNAYPSEDGLSIYTRDITERNRAEEKLRRGEAYLAEGQRLSHTGSWAWNVVTGDLYWSEEHFRICGLDPEKDRPSYPAMQWVHQDDRTMVQERFERAIRDRTDFELDCRVVWNDGTIRYVHSFSHPVFNETGDLTEYVGTILDTTERKRGEEARNELLRRLFAAQEDERRRMSRELHDEFGQQLTALSLNLAALKREHGGRARLSRQLASVEAIVTQLGSNVADLAWQLRPTALDALGLGAALTQYANKWSKHFEIHAELHMTGIESGRLTTELDTALYRIVQEALNNVAKHARARNVNIVVQRESEHVSLMIEDDGVGFDTKQAFDAHDKRLGLVGMRERATLLGGTLAAESEMGRGTIVVARVPAPPAPDSTNPR